MCRGKVGQTAIDRFMEKVEQRDGHWYWLGMKNPDGACPRFYVSPGKNTSASRWMHEHEHGELHANEGLRNTCGEKSCVHPDHWTPKGWKSGGNGKPVLERVVEKLTIDPDTDCHTFEGCGAGRRREYGQIRDDGGKCSLVHRVIYEHTFGPIPEGHQIHHICRNTRCSNPDHLEALSPIEHTVAHLQIALAELEDELRS